MNEKLKERRKEFHLTMQDISDMIGISKGYYSLIERGERRVSYELAFKIATALKTKPDLIFLEYQSTLSKHIPAQREEAIK